MLLQLHQFGVADMCLSTITKIANTVAASTSRAAASQRSWWKPPLAAERGTGDEEVESMRELPSFVRAAPEHAASGHSQQVASPRPTPEARPRAAR
jgi:hypothetical protein